MNVTKQSKFKLTIMALKKIGSNIKKPIYNAINNTLTNLGIKNAIRNQVNSKNKQMKHVYGLKKQDLEFLKGKGNVGSSLKNTDKYMSKKDYLKSKNISTGDIKEIQDN